MTDKLKRHEELCKQIHETFVAKNNDYGDSVHELFEKLGPITLATRLGDKYNRICSLLTKGLDKQLVKSESILDTFLDLANYAIIGYIEMEQYLNNFSQYSIDKEELKIMPVPSESNKDQITCRVDDPGYTKDMFLPVGPSNIDMDVISPEKEDNSILIEKNSTMLEKIESSYDLCNDISEYKLDKDSEDRKYIPILGVIESIKRYIYEKTCGRCLCAGLIDNMSWGIIYSYIADSLFIDFKDFIKYYLKNMHWFKEEEINEEVLKDLYKYITRPYINPINMSEHVCIMRFETFVKGETILNLIFEFDPKYDTPKNDKAEKEEYQTIKLTFTNFVDRFITFYNSEDGFRPCINDELGKTINKKFTKIMGGDQYNNNDDKHTTLDLLISSLLHCLPNPMKTYRVREAFKKSIVDSYKEIDESDIIYNSGLSNKYIKMNIILK